VGCIQTTRLTAPVVARARVGDHYLATRRSRSRAARRTSAAVRGASSRITRIDPTYRRSRSYNGEPTHLGDLRPLAEYQRTVLDFFCTCWAKDSGESRCVRSHPGELSPLRMPMMGHSWESSVTCLGPASGQSTARRELQLTGEHFWPSNDSKWPVAAEYRKALGNLALSTMPDHGAPSSPTPPTVEITWRLISTENSSISVTSRVKSLVANPGPNDSFRPILLKNSRARLSRKTPRP
jgi:hypothetical protein